MIHLALLIVSTYIVIITALALFAAIGALFQGVRWTIKSGRKR